MLCGRKYSIRNFPTGIIPNFTANTHLLNEYAVFSLWMPCSYWLLEQNKRGVVAIGCLTTAMAWVAPLTTKLA